MRVYLAIFLMLGLGACETIEAGRLVANEKGAEFADLALEQAEFVICRAASVGSVMRRYGSNTQTAQAYLQLCFARPDAVSDLITGEIGE